jgi:chlorobactene glucosyltransferase
VSIIVPARNEEHNIERCLVSLLSQDYPNAEVVLVNDNSTDGTARIASMIEMRFPSLRIITGSPLPKGWAGKNWACHQGVQASQGEILLFTDADTCHKPWAVSRAVSAMQSLQADFLTAFVSQETRSIGEKSVIPMVFWIAYSLFPFALMNKFRSLPLYFGNGQFMMMRSSAYQKMGGYSAIRKNVFDDMTLAKLARGKGLRSVVVDASRYVTCRMYRSMSETFKGLTKNVFALFKYSIPPFIAVPVYLVGLAMLGLTFFGPILSVTIYLLFFLFGVALSQALIVLTTVGLVFSLATFTIVYLKFNYPFHMIFVYPLNILLFLCIALGSLVLTSQGRTQWKGRALDYS